MYIPLLQNVFSTAPLGIRELCFVFAWTPIIILLDEIRKLLVRLTARM